MTTFLAEILRPDFAKDGVVNSLRTQQPALPDHDHCGCSDPLKRSFTPETTLGSPRGPLDALGDALPSGIDVVALGVLLGDSGADLTKKPLVGVVVL